MRGKLCWSSWWLVTILKELRSLLFVRGIRESAAVWKLRIGVPHHSWHRSDLPSLGLWGASSAVQHIIEKIVKQTRASGRHLRCCRQHTVHIFVRKLWKLRSYLIRQSRADQKPDACPFEKRLAFVPAASAAKVEWGWLRSKAACWACRITSLNAVTSRLASHCSTLL